VRVAPLMTLLMPKCDAYQNLINKTRIGGPTTINFKNVTGINF